MIMLGTFKLRAPELLFDNEPFVGSCEITKHQLRISEKIQCFYFIVMSVGKYFIKIKAVVFKYRILLIWCS